MWLIDAGVAKGEQAVESRTITASVAICISRNAAPKAPQIYIVCVPGKQPVRPAKTTPLDKARVPVQGGRELPIRVGGIPARSKPTDVSFSATGLFLAASFMHEPRVDDKPGFDDPDASYTLVWDLNAVDAAPQRIDVPFVGLYEHMRLSPDGRTVYVGAPLTAYDVKTGKVIFKRPEIKTWLPLDLNRFGGLISGVLR